MTHPNVRAIREIGRRAARNVVELLGVGYERPLIAAVSGGADSSAMLLLLADTSARHGWSLRAVHVDHLIQSESVREMFRSSSRQLAVLAGVPYYVAEADAPSEAERASGGLEAAARAVRYRALKEVALDCGAPAIVVAHTRDDQAETVLLHMIRGSGLDGLSGMPAVRDLRDGVRLGRPLLDVTRAETVAVCEAYGVTPAEDPSNDEPAYMRNRVRQSLLPMLESFNPNIAERLAELAKSVGADRELLELVGSQTLEQVRGASGELARRQFLALPGQLQVRVIRSLCAEQGITLTAERTAAVLQVILHGHGVVELSGGHHLTVARGTIALVPLCPPEDVAG
ncbi:MAG: tRNA lysidine(34) synthetase TilS [Chloroflexota bacterium]|nr:tRNA lysidine(34) synthetase TilS [Chloroflexota bacterium]